MKAVLDHSSPIAPPRSASTIRIGISRRCSRRAAAREALFALYAFDHEIAKVRHVVREPMAGLVRFQWWRDALDGIDSGQDLRRSRWSRRCTAHWAAFAPLRPRLDAAIDARELELSADPPADLAALERRLEAGCGEITLAAVDLLGASEAPAHAAARHLGLALGSGPAGPSVAGATWSASGCAAERAARPARGRSGTGLGRLETAARSGAGGGGAGGAGARPSAGRAPVSKREVPKRRARGAAARGLAGPLPRAAGAGALRSVRSRPDPTGRPAPRSSCSAGTSSGATDPCRSPR